MTTLRVVLKSLYTFLVERTSSLTSRPPTFSPRRHFLNYTQQERVDLTSSAEVAFVAAADGQNIIRRERGGVWGGRGKEIVEAHDGPAVLRDGLARRLPVTTSPVAESRRFAYPCWFGKPRRLYVCVVVGKTRQAPTTAARRPPLRQIRQIRQDLNVPPSPSLWPTCSLSRAYSVGLPSRRGGRRENSLWSQTTDGVLRRCARPSIAKVTGTDGRVETSGISFLSNMSAPAICLSKSHFQETTQ